MHNGDCVDLAKNNSERIFERDGNTFVGKMNGSVGMIVTEVSDGNMHIRNTTETSSDGCHSKENRLNGTQSEQEDTIIVKGDAVVDTDETDTDNDEHYTPMEESPTPEPLLSANKDSVESDSSSSAPMVNEKLNLDDNLSAMDASTTVTDSALNSFTDKDEMAIDKVVNPEDKGKISSEIPEDSMFVKGNVSEEIPVSGLDTETVPIVEGNDKRSTANEKAQTQTKTDEHLASIDQPLEQMNAFFDQASERMETSFKEAQNGDHNHEVSMDGEPEKTSGYESKSENDEDVDTDGRVNQELSNMEFDEQNESHEGSCEKQIITTERGTFFIKRKKRRRKSKLWTSAKSRRLSSGYSPKKPVIQVANTDISATEQSGTPLGENQMKDSGTEVDDEMVEAADGEDKQVGVAETGDKLTRACRTRVPMNENDYIIGDEAILDEIESVAKSKRRKGLLIDSGKKVKCLPGKTLSEEELNRYKKPFSQGWRREIVIRGVKEEDAYLKKKSPCDVYYFPPTGNKLRSMVQIAEWLSNHNTTLTSNNFTFMRQPIGVEEGEVVRHASAARGRASSEIMKRKKSTKAWNTGFQDHIHDDNDATYDKPEIVIERDSDDFLAPLIAAAAVTSASGSSVQISPLKKKLGRPPKSSAKFSISPKLKVKQDVTTLETIHPSNEQVIVSPIKKKIKATARKSTTQKSIRSNASSGYSGVENLCSVRCPGLENIPPMLHCNLCMCLFHAECVNYFGPDGDFVCLRCKDMKDARPDLSTPPDATSSPVMMSTGVPAQFVQPSGVPVSLPTPATLIQISRPSPHINPAMSIIRVALPTAASPLPLYKSLVYENINSPQAVSPQIVKLTPSSGLTVGGIPSTVYSLPSKPKVQPIAPAISPGVSVKQEPIDDSYDAAKGEWTMKGGQASMEMLGNLKNKLSSKKKITPSDVASDGNQELIKRLSDPSSVMRTVGNIPVINGLTSSSSPSNTKGLSPVPTSISNALNAMTRWSNAGSNVTASPVSVASANNPAVNPNTQYKLIPIGTPGPLPNLQFRQMHVPGTNLQGFVPVTSTHTPSSNVTSSPVLFGDLKKVPVTTIGSKTSGASKPLSKSDGTTVNSSGSLVVSAQSLSAINGQLLTLPPATVKKLSLNKPLSLKINNQQITVPPSGFFQSSDGLKVFLPPSTFTTAVSDLTYSAMEDKDGTADTTGNLPKLPNLINNSVSKSDANLISIGHGNEKSNADGSAKDKSQHKTSVVTVDKSVSTSSLTKCPGNDCVPKKFLRTYCYIQKLHGASDCMHLIFKFLNLKDLLRTSMVCRSWRHISQHPALWQHVSFRDLKVSDWQQAMQFLCQRLVNSISLLGLVHYEHQNRTWHQLVSALQGPSTLRSITFGLVPGSVLHSLCNRLGSLEVLNAERICDTEEGKRGVPTKLDIGKFACLMSLKELRLAGVCGLAVPSFSFGGSLSELGLLKNLEVLSVVSMRNVPGDEFRFVSKLTKLRELALGDCTHWTEKTYTELGKLHFLKKLRLENGGDVPDTGLGQALVNFPQLECLELHGFRICITLGIYLSQLRNLSKIVIRPDNEYDAPEMNSNTLSAVEKLTYIRQLDWIVPQSSSAAIILDDNENAECMDEGSQWIPFDSCHGEDESDDEPSPRKRQTEYIKVKQLKAKLAGLLPDTAINVYSKKNDSASNVS